MPRIDVPFRAARDRRPAAALWVAAALSLGSLAAGPAEAVVPGPGPAEEPAATLGPGIQYEDALAHAGDEIAFAPGGAVSVPFEPRPDDGWTVGGGPPRALPAGEASGRAMAASRNGTTWTDGPPEEPANGSRGAPTGRSAPVDGELLDLRALPEGTGTAAVGTTAGGSIAPAAASGLRRQVFGFLPYWELSDSSTNLNYSLLSTIAYFSVGADRNGNLLKQDPDGTTTTGWGGWTSAKLTSVINAAHSTGTRVVLTISVFAWTSGQSTVQATLLGSPTARANLARQAAAAVRDRGADGINLDFEPIVSGYADEFTALVREIRAQLDAIAPGYQLTFDTMGRIGNYPIEDATAPGGADAVFIMGYDYRTAGASRAGSIAPLAGPVYDITDTIVAYLARLPASKVILGVPYYGRAWSTVSSEPNATTQTGTKYGASASVVYETAIDYLERYGRAWDPLEGVAWTAYQRENCSTTYGCVTSWRELYIDDVVALKAKYDLVNRYGLRGAGIWALGYDGSRPELWRALSDKFLHDTTAPQSGIVPLPPAATDEGFSVTWAGADDAGVVAYDVQVSTDGGPWTAWLTKTPATSDVWLGATGHAYAFRARALHGQGNWSPWDVADTGLAPVALGRGGFARVTVDRLALRGGPDTGAVRLASANPGDLLAITGGPVAADGYTWYEVSGPLSSWGSVGFTQVGAWAAAGSGGAAYLVPAPAPNATRVSAGIAGLSFAGAGAASLGPAGAAVRSVSPNGDGWGDTLRLSWTNGVPLDSLSLRVLRTDGTMVGAVAIAGPGAPGPQSWDWDGTAGGVPLADGQYLLQLIGTSGGVTFSAPSATPATAAQVARYAVTIDTLPPTVGAAAISGAALSPNGDGRSDTIAASGGGVDATHWALRAAPIVDGVAAAAVRTISGATRKDGSVTVAWDGRADDGSAVPDGPIRLTLRLMDAAGNGADSSWDVTLDRRGPVVGASVTPTIVSPNGDGADDVAGIAWTSDEPVAGWVRILRGTTLIRRWAQPLGPGTAISWDGRDAAGRAVADGRYTVQLDVSDPAGNRVVRASTVAVIRAAGFLRWSPTAFYPTDGDRYAATARLTFRLTRTATTSLRIVDAAGTPVRTAWSRRTQGAGTIAWTWDGRTGAGARVGPGRYLAVLTAKTAAGTVTLTRTVFVDAFLVTPSATTLVAGETLTLTIRSVEPLSGLPSVSFAQASLAPVSIATVALGDGRYGATITIAAGGPGPATIIVEGRDAAGRLNRSIATVTVG